MLNKDFSARVKTMVRYILRELEQDGYKVKRSAVEAFGDSHVGAPKKARIVDTDDESDSESSCNGWAEYFDDEESCSSVLL